MIDTNIPEHCNASGINSPAFNLMSDRRGEEVLHPPLMLLADVGSVDKTDTTPASERLSHGLD